ncbi:MAG TPA: serine/threonine-protein kinase, partial [Micromonosporaceae bacterium]
MTWKLPGYVLEECLGRGSSGEVWQARVARTGQRVALKRIPIGDSAAVAAARTEAAVLAALDHPHLIRVHDLVPTVDAVVLVLDLADAGSLADLLRRRGRLTPGEVVTALAPIAAALAYAHTEGIVHTDVSSANVLFTSIGLPLLADLGLARIIGDLPWAQDSIRATPAYIDPVVAQGQLPGPPTDVFSLAAVAVHALRGRPIWPGPTSAAMVEQAAAAGVAGAIDIEHELPDAPASMRAVIGRALLADPHLRCTAAEFALDLRHSLAAAPVELRAGRERMAVPVAPPGPSSAPRAGERRTDRRRRSNYDRPAFGPDTESVDAAAGSAPAGVPEGQFTYGARLPAIDRLPRHPRRRSGSWLLRPVARLDGRQRRIGAAASSVIAVVVVGALVVVRPAMKSQSTVTPAVTFAAATTAAATTTTAPATATVPTAPTTT